MKKILQREVATIDAIDTFSGPIDEVIERLRALKTRYIDFHDLYLHLSSSHCYECSEDVKLLIEGKRPETDKEEAFRINRRKIVKEAAKKRKERERQVELEEYERLKKKFETAS
jgi:hypothetical protein